MFSKRLRFIGLSGAQVPGLRSWIGADHQEVATRSLITVRHPSRYHRHVSRRKLHCDALLPSEDSACRALTTPPPRGRWRRRQGGRRSLLGGISSFEAPPSTAV